MAYAIKQEYYSKVPTAEQRKVLNLLGISWRGADGVLYTRIEAHLAIRECIIDNSEAKDLLRTWRAARKADRLARRRARAAGTGPDVRLREPEGSNAQ